MRRSVWMRVLAAVLIISMLAAPVSAAARRPSPSYGTNCIVGGIISIIRDIIRDIWDDWFDVPGDEDPEPTPPEQPTDPSEPTEPGETEPEDPAEPEETLKTVLNLIEGHANTENGHLLRGVTYSLSQLAEEQSKPESTPGSLRDIKAIAIGAARAAAPTAQLNAAASSVQPMAEGDETDDETFKVYDGYTLNNWVNGGKYYIQSARAAYNSVGSWIAIENGAVVGKANQSDATLFTLYINDDGTCYLAFDNAGTTNYLSLSASTGTNGEAITTAPVAVTIDHITPNVYNGSTQLLEDDGNLLNIGSNGNYLNQYGGKKVEVYGAHNVADDNGNAMWFHLVTEDGVSQVTVTNHYLDAKVVMFPVTMYNYNTHDYNVATHNLELSENADPTVWNGLYFSDGSPTEYTGPVQVTTETNTVTAELVMPEFDETTGYITNLDAESQYILVNDRSGKTAVDASATRTGNVQVEEGVAVTNKGEDTITLSYVGTSGKTALSNSIWKYDTTPAIKSNAGAYLKFERGTSYFTQDVTPTYIKKWNANEKCVIINQGEVFLSDHGGNGSSIMAGWREGNEVGQGDTGHPFYIYKITDITTTTTETVTEEKTFTGIKYGDYNYFTKNTGDQDNGDLFYTGMVESELVEDEIVFKMPEAGVFSYDPTKINAENNYYDGVKNIYEFVGMPFILTENGVYSFDSDENGAYFKDTNDDTYPDPAPGTSTDYNELVFDRGNPQPLPFNVKDKSTNGWFPYNIYADRSDDGTDNPKYGTNSDDKNNLEYHFGMRADLPFSMTPNGRIKSTDDNSEPITFTFSGDDDVWIFIDGKLVVDLGGLHNRLDITINFAENTIVYSEKNGADTNNQTGSFNDTNFSTTQKIFNEGGETGLLNMTRLDFASNENHEMQFFYLERGEGTSNCRIEFNLPMRDTVLVTKDATMSWSAEYDAQDGDGDGTQKLTDREQAAVDNLLFGFTLYKLDGAYLDQNGNVVEGVAPDFYPVAQTNYFIQDKEGNVIGHGSTDANGKFYLKNGQTAKFMTDIPFNGVTYYLVEDQVPEGFLTPDYKYAGVSTYGFNYCGEALDPSTGGVVTNKGHVSDAIDMGEHELPMTEPGMFAENRSYIVTAKGSIESIDSLEFICINYVDERLPKPSAFANEDIIVIDYGLPVRIDPLANDLFRGDNIEIVAWGDESLTLNEVLDSNGFAVPDGTEDGTSWSGNKVLAAAKVAASNNSYNDNLIDLADCLYTFKDVGDGCYEVSATTADGTKVYLNHYTSDTNEIPHDSIPGRIKVADGDNDNMFKLIAQVMDGGTGGARTLHFHTEQTVPYWNRCGNDTSFKCQEYLYRPAGKDDVSSTEIPGYVMVTSLDQIVDGGQYLIVHDKDYNSTDDDLFVLHPSTSGDKYDHVAKLETTDVPAIGTSFSFDSGNVTFKDETYAETVNADGTVTFVRDSFEYELTEQLTEVETIHYIIKVTATETNTATNITTTVCRYSLAKVYIVPATIMYYEENFSDMVTFEGAGWDAASTVADSENVSDYQEPGVVGTVGDSTYGSDVAYLSDDGDSNGTYRFGDTTNKAIRFTYTFTGTGSSIFARTSAKTGYMQVKLYEGTTTDEAFKNNDYMEIAYRDTYWKYLNGNDLASDDYLYNIPVYTTENLKYGTYTIVCTVAKAGTKTEGNESGAGNEFYLDGIRVMQPLNGVLGYDEETDEVYYNPIEELDPITAKGVGAYATDGESNLQVLTLRQKLITDYDYLVPEEDENGEVIGEEEVNWPFAVLTDINGEIILASDYISIGPKEEVYLSAQTDTTNAQTVSFSLKSWEPEGLKLYMGMKAPFGHAMVNVGNHAIELKNAPDCYYDVTNFGTMTEVTDESGETYHVITFTFKATESIVSLTNIKVVGSFEFAIVESPDEEIDGSEGGN